MVFRPRRARLVIYPLIVLVLVALIVGAWTLPSEGPGGYHLGDRLGITALAVAVSWFLHRLAAVRIATDPEGVTVVNILRRRRLEWAEIVAVRLRGADPWLTLDLSDGEGLAAMGIQRADGARARTQAEQFARLVVAHSRTERND